MSKWEKYEEEKKKLKKMGLSHSEYEKAIINLCKKLKILHQEVTNMTNPKEFSYTIEKHFGTVSVAGSLPLELNLVSFAGAPARYDLRKWRDKANGEHTMQKGITLTREELCDLRAFLNGIEDI